MTREMNAVLLHLLTTGYVKVPAYAQSTRFTVAPGAYCANVTGGDFMVTIYGPRSTAEAMIARVRRMHDLIEGVTPSGEPYRANDPELLTWVHGTAAYGFLQAYHAYVRALSSSERDRYYADSPTATFRRSVAA
jgi:ER-bound oxygenase mpaB/B'/Rubber oxygenase, catalytic domain